MIRRIVKMTFREGTEEEFLALFARKEAAIRAFAGCRHLELLRNRHAPNVFFTLSLWDSEEALENYRQSQLFRQTWAQTRALFAARAEAWTLDPLPTYSAGE